MEERPGAKPGRGAQEASPSKKPRVEHPPRQPEPERQRQPQPQITVPVPGNDFAYFPEPGAATLELSKLSTATGHLIAEDLLREGLRHNGVRGRIKRTNNEHRQRSA